MHDMAQSYMAKYERAKSIRREFEELYDEIFVYHNDRGLKTIRPVKDVMIRYLMRQPLLAYKNLHLVCSQAWFLTLHVGLILLQVVKCLKKKLMRLITSSIK